METIEAIFESYKASYNEETPHNEEQDTAVHFREAERALCGRCRSERCGKRPEQERVQGGNRQTCKRGAMPYLPVCGR